ncbi:MAG: hypothetical protein LH702_03940 [Phormidesmis sp. CAN_BIN44]|nr:hypothetical protein [Phormidesmis sp. CAN_BIN44]
MQLKTPLGQQRSPLQPPPPLSPFLQTILIDQNQQSGQEFLDAWTPGNLSTREDNQPRLSNRAASDNLQESSIAAKFLDSDPAVGSIVQKQPLGIEPLSQPSDFLLFDGLFVDQDARVSPTTPQRESQPSNQTELSEVVTSQSERPEESIALDSNPDGGELTLPVQKADVQIALPIEPQSNEPQHSHQIDRFPEIPESASVLDSPAVPAAETLNESTPRSTGIDSEVGMVSETKTITEPNLVSDRLAEPPQQQNRLNTSELFQTQREPAFTESSSATTDLNVAEVAHEDETLAKPSQEQEIAPKLLDPQPPNRIDAVKQGSRQSFEESSLAINEAVTATEKVSASPLLDQPEIEQPELSLQTNLLQLESETTSAQNPTLSEESEVEASNRPLSDSSTSESIALEPQATSEVKLNNAPEINRQHRTEEPSLDLAAPSEAAEFGASQVSQTAIVQQIAPLNAEASISHTTPEQIQQDVQPTSLEQHNERNTEPFISPKTEESIAETTQSAAKVLLVENSPDSPIAEWLSANQSLAMPKDNAPIRLKPLGAPEPLVQLSNFLVPESEESDEPRPIQESISEAVDPITLTENKSVVHRSIASESKTERPPTPESWSSLSELLGELSEPPENHNSFEHSFTELPAQPIQQSSELSQPLSNTIQPSISNKSASTKTDSSNETPDEWSSLAELMGEQKSTQTTEPSGKATIPSVLPIETPVTLISPLIQTIQTAPQIGEARTGQKTEKIDPQDFEQLAQSVYRLIQSELTIERERYWNHDTGWVNSIILSTQTIGKSEQKGRPNPNNSQPFITDVKLQTLAREIHVQLQQQLEVERERYGICRQSF